MKSKFGLALLLAGLLLMTVTPAFAQGNGLQTGGNACFGGDMVVHAEETARDLFLAGCNGTIESNAKVVGTVAVFGGNLAIQKDALVDGDVAVFGGRVQIAGQVNGDVTVAGGLVELDSTAVVNGDVNTAGGNVTQQPGATVKGSISRTNSPRFPNITRPITPVVPPISPISPATSVAAELARAGGSLLAHITFALALAALGVLLVVLFPEPTRRVMETAETSMPMSFGVGCLTMILVPIITLVSIITLIGPVIMVVVAAVAWALGWIALGYLAGQRILEALKVHEIVPIVAVILGILVLAFVTAVPILGGLVWIVITAIGLGAVVLTRFGTRGYPFGTLPLAPAPAGGYAPIVVPPAPSAPAPRAAEPAAPVETGSAMVPAQDLHPEAPPSRDVTDESGNI